MFCLDDPIRGIINLYRDAQDSTSYHRDQYQSKEMNFTCGASFGATREISFLSESDYQRLHHQIVSNNRTSNAASITPNLEPQEFTFPQKNGDVFAFSQEVNSRFRHAVPRSRTAVQPRISLILWARRRINDIPNEITLSSTTEWSYEEAVKKDPRNFRVRIAPSDTLTYEH